VRASEAGFHHPLVRAARALHLKKHRQDRRCFLIEGPTAIAAALGAPAVRIEQIFAAPRPGPSDDIAERAASAGVQVIAVDERTLRSLAQTREPQGIVAVARFFHHEIADLPIVLAPPDEPCVVAVMHAIADPGNAGTLLRSAEALGASAICCGSGGVDPYNEKVVRASMGALFHVPLFCYAGWTDFAKAAHAAGLSVVATAAGAPDVRSVTIPRRSAVLVGHERRGLSDIPAADVALEVGIPQSQRAESLNAAVAGSIALYEIARASGVLPNAARTNDA